MRATTGETMPQPGATTLDRVSYGWRGPASTLCSKPTMPTRKPLPHRARPRGRKRFSSVPEFAGLTTFPMDSRLCRGWLFPSALGPVPERERGIRLPQLRASVPENCHGVNVGSFPSRHLLGSGLGAGEDQGKQRAIFRSQETPAPAPAEFPTLRAHRAGSHLSGRQYRSPSRLRG